MVVTQDGGLQLALPGWPLGCCFPTASRARSHVIVLVEAWADSRVLWGLQHCDHERESGLPEEEASPPVSRVCFGETRVVGDDFPRVLSTSAGAVTGSGAQAAWREEARSAPRGTGPQVHRASSPPGQALASRAAQAGVKGP